MLLVCVCVCVLVCVCVCVRACIGTRGVGSAGRIPRTPASLGTQCPVLCVSAHALFRCMRACMRQCVYHTQTHTHTHFPPFSLLSPPPLALFLFLPLPPCARSQADATRGRRSHGGTIRVMSKIRMKGREARGGMGGERESVVGEIPNLRRVFVLNLNSVGKSRKKEEEKRDRATPALSLARSRAPWRPPVVLFV